MMISWGTFAQRHPLAAPVDMPGRHTAGKDLCAVLTLAAAHKPAKILELYTAAGETAAHLGRVCPQSTIYTFDVCKEMGGYDGASKYAQREVRAEAEVGAAARGLANVRCVVDNGLALPGRIKAAAPYQFVFIDGDHTWRRVAEDTKLALACAADDALLVWDDYWYYCPEVGHFIDLLNERLGNYICHVGDTRVCFTPLNPEVRARMIKAVADL